MRSAYASRRALARKGDIYDPRYTWTPIYTIYTIYTHQIHLTLIVSTMEISQISSNTSNSYCQYHGDISDLIQHI